VFPIPIDVVRPMMDALGGMKAASTSAERLAEEARTKAEEIEAGGHPALEPGDVAHNGAAGDGLQENGSASAPTPAPASAPTEAPETD
jgi:hypothetical protein